jgi:hypothetical protein
MRVRMLRPAMLRLCVLRLGMLGRGLWPDGNPLRRRCDRAEAAMMGGLLAAFLAGAPAVAVATAHWIQVAGSSAEHAQEAVRRLAVPAGAPMAAWIAEPGRLPDQVPSRGPSAFSAPFASVLAVLLLGLLLLAVAVAVRRLVNRRRMAAWEADWAVTGPRWTSRR